MKGWYMGAEGLGYSPEDLLQTEGDNKGNVKDVGLAQEMVEGEDEYRDKKKENRRMIVDVLSSIFSLGSVGASNTEELANSAAKEKAQEVIKERVQEKASQKDVTEETVIKKEADVSYKDFDSEQKRLTEERIDEQRKKIREL